MEIGEIYNVQAKETYWRNYVDGLNLELGNKNVV